MPFLRPGLGTLNAQALSDLAGSPLRWVISKAIAWAVANLANGHYGYLDWISRQSVPFTATDEFLEAWAGLVGILRKPPTAALGQATWAGQPGTLLPLGTLVARADGAAFSVQADATVDATGSVTCIVLAAAAGAAGNTAAGTRMTLGGSIAGINSAGLAGLIVAGADQETDDALRTRMLERYAAPPQGGALADYLEWALAVPGVTRAWVNPLGSGPGTVVCYAMWDGSEAAFAGFPQGSDGVASAETRDLAATGDQLVLANALYSLRPVTALVYSVSPLAGPINFVMHPRAAVPAATQALVLAAIDGVFLALASPLGVELETSPFEAAIAAVAGMPAFTLTAPAGPVSLPLGRLPIRGAVIYA